MPTVMMLRHSAVGLGLTALLACSASNDDAGANTSDVSATTEFIACGLPVPTPDGKWIVHAGCGTNAGVEATGTVGGGTHGVGFALLPGDTIEAVGTTGQYAYWLERHADQTVDFAIDQAGSGSTLATRIPLGAGVRTVEDAFVFENGTVGFLLTGSDATQEIVVTKLGAHDVTLRTALDKQRSFGLHRSSLGLVAVEGTIFSKPRMALVEMGATPRLHPLVAPQTDDSVLQLLPDSMLGGSLVAAMTRADGTRYIANIVSTTGKVNVLREGFDKAAVTLVSVGESVWYTAHGPDGWVLEQLNRTMNPHTPRRLATDPDGIDARLSADGATVLYRLGGPVGPHEVLVVPSDGALPPTVVVPRSANQLVSAIHDAPRNTPRVLFRTREVGTEKNALVLVDDTSGATFGTWDAVGPTRSFVVSPDGSSLIALRSCNTSGAAPSGWLLEKLWPNVETVRGCTTGEPPQRIPVPGSDTILLVAGRPAANAAVLVSIVRP